MLSARAVGALLAGAVLLRWRPRRPLVASTAMVLMDIPFLLALALGLPVFVVVAGGLGVGPVVLCAMGVQVVVRCLLLLAPPIRGVRRTEPVPEPMS